MQVATLGKRSGGLGRVTQKGKKAVMRVAFKLTILPTTNPQFPLGPKEQRRLFLGLSTPGVCRHQNSYLGPVSWVTR